MNVLVDTCIWSLALRRRSASLSAREAHCVADLESLILSGRVAMIAPIRQELLAGIRNREQFRRLRDYLLQFRDETVHTGDYIAAAELSNSCLDAGFGITAVDALLASVAISRRWPVFTNDSDFELIARHSSLRLYEDD